jgi:predicted SAM-dependent methyltransferase
MVKLNLGCGLRQVEGYVNIDARRIVYPDLLCDILSGLPYANNTVDEVRAWDFLEHIPLGQTVGVIDDIWRVLKPGGIFESFTPDAETGQGAFQDPTHVSFWVENSWLYYSHPAYRELYGIRARFDIKEMERVETDKQGRVYHLHVVAEAVKEVSNAL